MTRREDFTIWSKRHGEGLHAFAISCDPICRALNGLGGSLYPRMSEISARENMT